MSLSNLPVSRRMRSTTLVARAEQVAIVDQLIARTAAGHGALALIHGEPGVGKSRLLSDCLSRARAAGANTLIGRAVEGGGPFRPLSDALLARMREYGLPKPDEAGPFAVALGRLVPGWITEQGPELVPDLPLLISEGLLRLLRQLGAAGGVVLALDDLHLADADTLTVLDRLVEAIEDSPILLLATARDPSAPVLDRLAAGTSSGDGSWRLRLPLARMTAAEVSALVASCAEGMALPAQVYRHVAQNADGLPFLVEELLGALIDSGALVRTAAGWETTRPLSGAVPASFAAAVRARVEGLDPPTRVVVDAAAVIGREIDWRLLPAVIGRSEQVVLDALRVAVDRQLLVYDGDRPNVFCFIHALTREAVLDRVLPPVRVAVAGAAAAALEQDRRDLELLAEMYATAGDTDRAAAALREAARQAGAAVGTREHLLRRSLDLAPSDDSAVDLTEVLVLAGRAAEAKGLGAELLERLPRDDRRHRMLAMTLARAGVLASQWDSAAAYLAEAGGGADVDALAAHVAFGQHRRTVAEQLAMAAVAASDCPEVQCEALEIVGRCQFFADHDEDAAATFGRAIAIAQAHNLTSWQIRAMTELGRVQPMGPDKLRRFEEARRLAVDAGLLSSAARVDLELMKCNAMLVKHDAVRAAALRGEELALSLRLPVLAGAARLFLAMTNGHTGRIEEMLPDLSMAHRYLGNSREFAAFETFVRGVPAMVNNDLKTFRAHLEAGMKEVRRSPSEPPSPFLGLYCLIETVIGDGLKAREELRSSGATTHWTNRAALAYADAVAAGCSGCDPQAHLDFAEAVMEPFEWRRHHARLLISPAALHDGWGRPIEWLRAASAHFEAAGDFALAKACRESLRSVGAPIPRRGRGDSPVPERLQALGVTSREVDVLRLVAAGRGNAEIAQRLCLSPRTVETHIGNLYSKTGVGTRSELVKLITA